MAKNVYYHPLEESNKSFIDSDNDLDFIIGSLEKPIDDLTPLSTVSSSSSTSSKNRYLHPVTETVEPLRPEEVRWFYKYDNDKKAKWTPMIGYDSLRVECQYREFHERRSRKGKSEACAVDRITVKGGLYEADVKEKKCFPIYWQTEENISIMRGTWFYDSTYAAIDEETAERIEKEHLDQFESEKLIDVYSDSKGPYTVLHSLKFPDFYIEWHATNSISLYYESTSSKIYRAVGARLGLSQMGTRLRRGYVHEAVIDDKLEDITHLVFVVHGVGQKMNQGNIIKRCSELRELCEKMKSVHKDELTTTGGRRVEFLPVEWRSSLKLDGEVVDSITPTKNFKVRNLLNSSAMDIMYYTSPLYRSEITVGLQSRLDQLHQSFCERHPYFSANGGKVSIIAHSLGAVIIYDIITGWEPMLLYDKYASKAVTRTAANFKGTAGDMVQELETARAKVIDLETKLYEMAEQEQKRRLNLPFQLQNLFCLGSPLAVFLAMRGTRPGTSTTTEAILPRSACKRIFNIFHPRDPVAYRIEPLVLRHYETLLPVKIYNHDQSKKVPYEALPLLAYSEQHYRRAKKKEERSSSSPTNSSKDSVTSSSSSRTKETSPPPSSVAGKETSGGGWGSFFRRNRQQQTPHQVAPERVMEEMKEVQRSSSPDSARSDYLSDDESECMEVELKGGSTAEAQPASLVEQTELEFRIDYQLREASMSNAYWSTLTSHTSYWNSPDTAFFILQQIFPSSAKLSNNK